MLRVIVVLVALLCFVPGAPPADAQQRFTQNPISLQNAAGADGNGSAITTKGYLSVALQVTGTFTATVNFEGTADASTWVALKCVNVATDSRTTTLTAAGMVQCNVQGMSSLRARVSGWSDGTVTVTGYLMDVVLGSTSGGSGGGGGDATAANQTTIIGHVDGIEGLLGTIDTDTGNIATNTSNTASGVGATSDAAVAAGDAGSVTAQLRRLTTDLDAVKSSVQTIDNFIESTRGRVTLYDSAGAEIVIPTAGSTHYDAADASTNSTNVKSAAGTVYHYSVSNTTSTLYYLRMYNLASAPTCSSATGFVESIPIPASTSGGGRERVMNIGQAFTTGISYCITASSGSTANDAAAAGVYVTILYK